MNGIELLKDKVLQLDSLIKSEHPGMPVMLRDIREHIRQDPELVTLISEDEIGIIVLGLKRHTGAIVTDAMVKGANKSSIKKALAKLNDDDLGL